MSLALSFSTSAPVIIHNQVIVGVAGDGGTGRGLVQALDPETGELKWKGSVTPEAGGIWQQPTYDADLNLMYVTTGQPTPTYNGSSRPGSNLCTCSVVALNPDTGKLIWYYQFSPHDTHDWDSTQVPVLIDGTINGQSRKLLAQANRSGYYFLLDRTNGKPVATRPFIATTNAYKGLDANGVLIPDPAKEPAPSFNPETGLFYFNATNAASIFYAQGNSNSEYHTGLFDSSLLALDYRTGEVKWSHHYAETGFWSSTYPGMLTTAGGLLFTGDFLGVQTYTRCRVGKKCDLSPEPGSEITQMGYEYWPEALGACLRHASARDS